METGSASQLEVDRYDLVPLPPLNNPQNLSLSFLLCRDNSSLTNNISSTLLVSRSGVSASAQCCHAALRLALQVACASDLSDTVRLKGRKKSNVNTTCKIVVLPSKHSENDEDEVFGAL